MGGGPAVLLDADWPDAEVDAGADAGLAAVVFLAPEACAETMLALIMRPLITKMTTKSLFIGLGFKFALIITDVKVSKSSDF
jgi:hypothetical protein